MKVVITCWIATIVGFGILLGWHISSPPKPQIIYTTSIYDLDLEARVARLERIVGLKGTAKREEGLQNKIY